MSDTLMSCGCTGMTRHTQAHDGLPENHPSCLTHDNCKVATQAPDLTGRQAKCSYNTNPTAWKPARSHGPIYGGGECSNERGKGCRCVAPSATTLPFFRHQPDKEFDQFYCGCFGWD